jgi:hypothetical protein
MISTNQQAGECVTLATNFIDPNFYVTNIEFILIGRLVTGLREI